MGTMLPTPVAAPFTFWSIIHRIPWQVQPDVLFCVDCFLPKHCTWCPNLCRGFLACLHGMVQHPAPGGDTEPALAQSLYVYKTIVCRVICNTGWHPVDQHQALMPCCLREQDIRDSTTASYVGALGTFRGDRPAARACTRRLHISWTGILFALEADRCPRACTCTCAVVACHLAQHLGDPLF
jgi:hypothetical protein